MTSTENGTVLGGLQDGDWVMYGGVDLGSGGAGSTIIELTVATGELRHVERTVEVWLDRAGGGRRIATCALPGTGGLDRWQTIRCPVRATGTHDVYLQVSGGKGEVLRLASLRFAAR